MLPRLSCLGLVLVLSSLVSPSHATNYTIAFTGDVVALDGRCSLREALTAINTQVQVNECAAGSSSNNIYLTPGQAYALSLGELVIGDDTTSSRSSVSIEPVKEDDFDREIKENPVIEAAAGNRIASVHDDSVVTLNNITLSGGDVTGGGDTTIAVAGAGGLLFVQESRVTLGRQAVLENGAAVNGGAVYLVDGILDADTAVFSGNSATASGGAVFTDLATSHRLTFGRVSFLGNSAAVSGGAIHAGGATLTISAANSTFYGNSGGGGASDGAVLHVNSDDRQVLLNNVTIAGNDGAGSAALWYSVVAGGYPTDELQSFDRLLNSVVVGNEGGSCAGSLAVDANALIDYTLSQSTNPCPADEELLPDNFGLSATADFDVLAGDAGACPAGTGSATCAPIVYDNGQSSFLPNDAATAPVIINAASPVNSTRSVCQATDQRETTRLDRCDPGAVEYRITVGREDEFFAVTGVLATGLDFLENDLGDGLADCTSLVTAALPIDNVPADDPDVVPCVQVVQPPLRGSVFVSVDIDGMPTFNYRSQAGFHGLDSFVYRMPDGAFSGRTLGDLGVSAPVAVVVEPASGLTEYDSIRDGGSIGMGALMLIMLGWMRRYRHGLSALFLGLASGSVNAANIFVDSTLDEVPTVINDGNCTLREALGNAIDESPVFSPDCAAGATGRDRIFLPAGTIELVDTLIVQLSPVEVIGEAPDTTIISGQVNGVRPILSRSPLVLKSLTVSGGTAPGSNGGAVLATARLGTEDVIFSGNSAGNAGGAIFLDFNVNEQIDVEIIDTLFDSNTAVSGGGAIAMVAQTQDHIIEISNSAFIDNSVSAGGLGGAIQVSTKRGGVALANVTFSGNDGQGTSAVYLSDPNFSDPVPTSRRPSITFMNTTFLNTVDDGISAPGVDADGPLFNVNFSHVIYTDSGDCSAAPSAVGFLRTVRYSLFDSDPAGTSCSAFDVTGNENVTFDAGIVAALDGGALTPLSVVDDQLFVPYFEITDPAFSAIVDAGKPGKQVDGLVEESFCRAEDVLGNSRLSGLEPDRTDPDLSEGCDLGAFELQVPTAVDDEWSNGGRNDRLVVVDVLANDLSGLAGDFDLDSIVITLQPASATISVPEDIEVVPAGDDRCLLDENDQERPCVLVTYELDAPLDCAQVSPDPFIDAFRYTFDDDAVAPNTSTEGQVNVEISNVPARFRNQTVLASRGDTVVFPLSVTDADGTVDTATFQLEDAPLFAKRDDNGTPDDPDDDIIFGVGVIVDAGAGTVTYVPNDRSKAFSDAFSLAVADDCGAKSTAVYTVRYRDDSAAGGNLLGGGGWGHGLCLLILMTLIRRKQ